MKKIIFILGLAAVVLGTSCSDVLDLNPADRFSPATVWSTTTTADKYVIGLYSIFGANTEMRGGDAYSAANSVRTGSRFVSPKCVSAVPTPISCCAGFTAG